MSEKYYIFEEGRVYHLSDIKVKINNEFYASNFCKKYGDKITFNIVGFIFVEEALFIVFPKGQSVKLGDHKSHIKTLLKVLLRYSNENNQEAKENILFGEDEGTSSETVLIGIKLLTDFLNYGWIRKQDVHYRVNNGTKIHWVKTINKIAPVMSNGRPIYLDLVKKYNSADVENLLYRLHRFVVQQSYKKFGWLMGIEEFEIDPLFDEMPCELQEAEYLLNQELSRTFVDREIMLLHYIKKFILGSMNKSETKVETLITKYFHHIWEAICSDLFQNEYDQFKELIPKPKWTVVNKKYKPREKARQIPDVLYVENDTLYVLDAKYYNIHSNLPGWHDLVKQFFYAYSLGMRLQLKTENALLFPGDVEDHVEYFGYVDIENDPKLGVVHAYVVNLSVAMDNYGNYRGRSLRGMI